MTWHPQFLVALMACSQALTQPIPDPCLKAMDYKGCKVYHNHPTSGQVVVDTPNDHEYRQESIRQQKVRGRYGRYLTFTGTTLNTYEGTPAQWNPGRPGTKQCDTVYGYNNKNKRTTCSQVGYIAPSYTPAQPGGVERRSFRYQLDCNDMTFDRRGDFNGFGNKGWLNVDDDPTAQAVANHYCPIIKTLPKQKSES